MNKKLILVITWLWNKNAPIITIFTARSLRGCDFEEKIASNNNNKKIKTEKKKENYDHYF